VSSTPSTAGFVDGTVAHEPATCERGEAEGRVREGEGAMTSNGRRAIGAVLALVMLVAVAGAAAQEGSPPPASSGGALAGHLARRMTAASDSSEHFALYVPSSLDPSRDVPVLFVMDPRGRALHALKLFTEPAEALGWIVLSSYETVSDSTLEPNERAVGAMLEEAQRLFPVDTARLYFAGFSGTARLAWLFALELQGHAAGILGFAAGFPNALPPETFAPLRGGSFSFFGGAGVRGFNYEEVRELEPELEALGIPARIVDYPGGHAWAPREVAARGMAWLELRAIRAGLAPEDSVLVDSLLEVERREAHALDDAGDGTAALRAYRDLVEDFSGVRDVEADRERASHLIRSPEVRRRKAREEALRKEGLEYRRRLARVLAEAAREEPALSPDDLARRLDVDDLLRRTEGGDSLDAAAARRMLAAVEVQARYYVPKASLAAGRPDRALALLAVAARIAPEDPGVCLWRARALAAEGRDDEAFAAIRCALGDGLPSRLLSSDPYLAALRSDPRWAVLVGTATPDDSSGGRRRRGGA